MSVSLERLPEALIPSSVSGRHRSDPYGSVPSPTGRLLEDQVGPKKNAGGNR